MVSIGSKIPLKRLIAEQFTKESKKIFYSIEVTPKWNFEVELPKLNVKPLFVGVTWISDQNLKYENIGMSPALKLKKNIEQDVNVVNTLTCFKLEDKHLDDLLNDENSVRNLTVLRGDASDNTQKYKYANDLIKEIRRRTEKYQNECTIFAACYPSVHPEAENLAADLKILKEKVDAGVDVLLTQLIFSSAIFCEFVKNCRNHGISVPILPGFYIPSNREELEFMSKISKVAIPEKLYEEFKEAVEDEEKFRDIGLRFTTEMIREIQEKSPEHIPGFHFFTMNNLTMVNKLTQVIEFS